MQREHRLFVVWDYVVFSLVLVVSAAIGIFYGCTGNKQATTKEFFMADRQMQVLPVTLSLLASFMSAIMILGTPAEVYLFGSQYMFIGVGYCMLMPACAYLYIPVFYRLRITSAYEYLEYRFKSRALRMTGACIFTLQMTMYLAIVLYAPSLALNAVTGLNVWVSVFSVGCVCTFYTALGGMKAVMWTDVFQTGMMIAGLLAVVIQGCITMGGFNNVWNVMDRGQRIVFFDYNPDPGARHTVWSLSIGAFFTWLAINGVNQAQVQRCLTCPTLQKAQWSLMFMLPGLILLLLLTSFAGMVMYAYYEGCDPLLNNEILATDQLLPLFVMDALGHMPGLPGLFVACMFSGTLSTISSGLNSLAAVTIQDIVKGCCFTNISEERATLCAKIMAFGYGILMIVLTFVAAQMGSVLQAALALFGILGGPVLGIFTLGLFFPQANSKGAFAGLAVALPLLLWIGVGAVVVKPPYPAAPLSVSQCPTLNATLENSTWGITTHWDSTQASVSDEVMQEPRVWTPETHNKTFFSTPDYRDGWDRWYSLSYLWLSMVAVLVVCGVGLPVSLLTGGSVEDVDRRTICPLFDITCPCLPESWRSKLRCGLPSDNEKSVAERPDNDKPSNDHNSDILEDHEGKDAQSKV